ncbi:MAG: Ppx/GppA family phosphatase [Nitrospiraceae bacterium]|nr:MAG: Ppx/GppA family phosphatase [Nitrospiraceae bacterium]
MLKGYNSCIVKTGPLAAIDIGTNTFRLLIANVRFNPLKNTFSIREIFSDRIITRLGEGLESDGLLKKQAITGGLAALRKFSDSIDRHRVYKTSAVATSALREAKNSDDFIGKAKGLTGLDIKIISGEEEARLTASGMLTDIAAPETALMTDIGGGSTELIFARRGKPVIVKSIDLGVVYLAGKYMRHDPPLKEDLTAMDRCVSLRLGKSMKPYLKLITHDSKPGTVFIGTAGTITTLAAVMKKLDRFEHKKVHRTRLTLEKVKSIFSAISGITSVERAKFLPFGPERLDIIVPGTLILLKLMEISGFREIIVSDYGLREGILIELHKELSGTDERESFKTPD